MNRTPSGFPRTLPSVLHALGPFARDPAILESEARRIAKAGRQMRAQGLPGVAEDYMNTARALRECATIAREIQL